MEESLEEYLDESNSYHGSLDDLPPPAEQEVYDYEESQIKKKRQIGVYWNKPVTKVYRDNFGFGVNGYQPMIDYLDTKDSGGRVDKGNVHLPYLEERCMNKYSSKKPFKLYNNKDIDAYIEKGEKIRTQIRQNDAAGASNVLRRTHTNWSMTRKSVQLVKNSYVVDYRKLHSDKDEEDEEAQPNYSVPALPYRVVPRYTVASLLSPLLIAEMESSGILSSYIRNKLDHDNEMMQRRERLRALDQEYEQTLNKLSHTVDMISKRAESMPRIISPAGRVYSPQDMMDVADDLILSNRMKRQQDLYRMSCDVRALTDGTGHYVPKTRPCYDSIDTYRVNPTVLAIARRNANEAIHARNRVNRGFGGCDNDDSEVDELRKKYLGPPSQELEDTAPPRRRIKRREEDIASDVQTRILTRAREMAGLSAESCRINNRARFVNMVTPRPDTGAVDLRVPPSKTERNIVNMANSLAYTGKPVRRYDVDDEVDPPVSNLNTNATKEYCTREYQKPVPEVPPESHRVRNANIRARTRNTLLGN